IWYFNFHVVCYYNERNRSATIPPAGEDLQSSPINQGSLIPPACIHNNPRSQLVPIIGRSFIK
ncbi:MAG: hypothetical protein ACM3MI_06125, partial [Clostridiales bacterium]